MLNLAVSPHVQLWTEVPKSKSHSLFHVVDVARIATARLAGKLRTLTCHIHR